MKTLVADVNVYKFIRGIFSWIKRLFLSFVERKRYIILKPLFFTHQIIYDKRKFKFINILIRDSVDAGTLTEIYWAEVYDILKLKRSIDFLNFYEKIENKKPLILDCGANIGLASKYFLSEFANSKVIAIEPDLNNFNQLKLNISNQNIETHLAAIGSASGFVKIFDPGLGNNGLRVINSNDTEDLKVITVNEILRNNEGCVPFIIKIDIEGYETELFSKNTEWIDMFPILIVELHDWMIPKAAVSKNFLTEISKLNRDLIFSGGNYISISNTM